jgi:type IV pilus assembly protein PilE
MKMTKRHNGFTLIEVMITLVLLAILTAIAIPAYQGYISTSRQTEGHNNLAALQMAEEEFFLENNQYFVGGDWSTLQTNSNGLWTRTGSEGEFNFDYAVALSGGGYVATATGTATGKVPGVVLTVNKQ